jgi:putative ABC transport system ATP-binding protein
MTMATVEIDQLVVSYGRDDYTVTPIDHFDLTVQQGQLALLLGPSGCGKTTLLSCLSGILRPTSGTITVGGTEITGLDQGGLGQYRRSTVGIVFQAFNLVPSLDATENVMVPLRAAGRSRSDARARALELLDSVGLSDRAKHHPGSMSGGQQQRVAIARALALDPALIVADEPTANLDHVQVETVLRILRGLTARGCTVVVSTHDHRLIPLADQLVEMQPDATPVAGNSTEESHLAAGEVLFEQGSFGDRIYDISEGQIEILHVAPDGVEHTWARLGPGEQFGEMGALFRLPRSGTARAVTASTVVAYTVPAFHAHFGPERAMELVARSSS